MADLIQVSSQVMYEKSTTLSGAATNIQTLTNELKAEISKMKSAWEGSAAEKFVQKFNGLNDDFQEKFDTINKYAQFLKDAADEFSIAETETVNQEDDLIS